MTKTPEQPPKIPGVRYRKVRRTAWEPVTFNGETKMVKRVWTEEVPRLPLNLDLLYVRAAIGVAVFLTCVAVVWSTMAIGRQLAALVPEHPRVGYLGACAFELPWVTCLAIGWVLRNQPDRARPVNIAGWVGLGVVVAAIILDGYRLDELEVGILGAFVSIVAKGLWWVITRLFHVPLDEDHAGWLDVKRQELAVGRVMLGEQQRLSGVEAYLAYFGVGPSAPAQRVAIAPAAPAAELLPAPEVKAAEPSAPSASVSGQGPASSVPAPGVPPMPSTPPVPSTPSGQPSAPFGPVPSAPSAQAPATPAPPASATNPAPSTPSAPVPSGQGATPIGTVTIASVVRDLLEQDPGLRDLDRRDELVALAAQRLPAQHQANPKKFRETVLRNTRVKVDKPRTRRKAAQ